MSLYRFVELEVASVTKNSVIVAVTTPRRNTVTKGPMRLCRSTPSTALRRLRARSQCTGVVTEPRGEPYPELRSRNHLRVPQETHCDLDEPLFISPTFRGTFMRFGLQNKE
jgi:hypothetical protein